VSDEWRYDETQPDVWTWLQAWYVMQCDDDWEHGHGITINTLDNPGWSVAISLTGTSVADAAYSRRELHRSDDDWCITWVEAEVFNGACGPSNLGEALHHFRAWATGSSHT
jgi:hypothetical protein